MKSVAKLIAVILVLGAGSAGAPPAMARLDQISIVPCTPYPECARSRPKPEKTPQQLEAERVAAAKAAAEAAIRERNMQKLVQQEADRLGLPPHRRQEARKLVEMRIAAGLQPPPSSTAEASARPTKAVKVIAGPAPSSPAPGKAASTPKQPEKTDKPGQPLRFYLMVPMRNPIKIASGLSNSWCYSNIITVPGPPNWPNPDLRKGTAAARALVEAYFGRMQSACARHGPSAGGAEFEWNEAGHDVDGRFNALNKRQEGQMRVGL